MLAMVGNEYQNTPIITPLASPRTLPPMKSTSDASRAPSLTVVDRSYGIRQGLRKGADNKVHKEKLSLNWTRPFKVIAFGPSPAADTPDGRPLENKLLYLHLPSNLSGPAAKPRVSVARCKPCANPYGADDIPRHLPAGFTQYVLHAFATMSPPYHVTTDDVSTSPIQSISLRSQVTNVYAAEAVQLLSYMRHTGTASSVPHGNENWISKPSDTSFLPIGRMVQTITNPTLGSINSCVLTQPRARSPAPKMNATPRVPTDSLLTTSTAPAFYPLLCLLEPPFGSIPLMVPGGLVKPRNPPTSSDATSYGSSTTQTCPDRPPKIRL